MAYKYLNRSAVLEHLQEGQTVNIDEYIEKMQFFKKYGNCQGIYITDSRYIEYAEIDMPITGARDAERTLKQRKIRTH